MKRRVEQLLREVRLQAFRVNSSYSDEVLNLYLNEAQNEIRKIIFIANNESNILKAVHDIDVIGGTFEYDLPERIFAENSLDAVKGFFSSLDSSSPFQQLQPVSIRNYNKVYGYTVINNQIWISSISRTTDLIKLQIVYSAELPTLAIRSGRVASKTATQLTLDAGFDTDLWLKSDYITVVDSNNNQIQTDILIQDFNAITGVITIANTDAISVGQYVLAGEYSTNISSLPFNCVDYLKKYVERRIAKEDGSKDFNTADLFTSEEKANIGSIFAESSKDAMLPEFSPNSPII